MAESFPAVPDLAGCLRQLLMQVPAGRVTTCGDLAEALGNKVAATWVGHFALHHDHDADCACHRILRAGGILGPFITTSEDKEQRLAAEGVAVQDGRVDLERFEIPRVRLRSPLGTIAAHPRGNSDPGRRPIGQHCWTSRPNGIALRPTAGSRRPIFISPGHRVDLPFCERVVRQLLTGHRLPEPLYWANRLSRAERNLRECTARRPQYTRSLNDGMARSKQPFSRRTSGLLI